MRLFKSHNIPLSIDIGSTVLYHSLEIDRISSVNLVVDVTLFILYPILVTSLQNKIILRGIQSPHGLLVFLPSRVTTVPS